MYIFLPIFLIFLTFSSYHLIKNYNEEKKSGMLKLLFLRFFICVPFTAIFGMTFMSWGYALEELSTGKITGDIFFFLFFPFLLILFIYLVYVVFSFPNDGSGLKSSFKTALSDALEDFKSGTIWFFTGK